MRNIICQQPSHWYNQARPHHVVNPGVNRVIDHNFTTLVRHQYLNSLRRFCWHNCTRFNPKKSACFKVGRGHDWLKSVAHVKCVLRKHDARVGRKNKISGMRVDTGYIRRKFYTACNGIPSYSRTVDEFVKLGLVKSFCLPRLTFAP